MSANLSHPNPTSSMSSRSSHERVSSVAGTDPNLSTCSLDSASYLVGQGDFVEGASRGYLPSFHSASTPNPKSSATQPRTRLQSMFLGWRVVVGSWFNVLLVLIPLAWTTTWTLKSSHSLTFTFCILAMIPLVRLHELSTKELSNRIGGSRTGLLNASMSNFVEVVVAISALRKCELRVVQSTLMGSMLSKLLLVLGLCFFAGGLRFSEQGFDPTATHVNSSLLSLSVGALLLPAAYHFTLGNAANWEASDDQKRNILHMSHGLSIVLIFIYVGYLIFQLWSHTHLYNDQHNKKSDRLSASFRDKRTRRKQKHAASALGMPLKQTESLPDLLHHRQQHQSYAQAFDAALPLNPPRRPFAASTISSRSSHSDIVLSSRTDSPLGIQRAPYFSTSSLRSGSTSRVVSSEISLGGYSMTRDNNSSGLSNSSTVYNHEGERLMTAVEMSASDVPSADIGGKKEPQLSWFLTIFLLVVVTGSVAVTVDWLVEAMDEISMTISKQWVGLILLPAISSIAAVKVSVKDELTLSISVAVGSTIQTALLVIPFTVILAWVTDKPLSLLMDPFQSMVLYIAVNTMGYVVADGKSNWLEGIILICLYIIIAVSFWFYPGSDLALGTCIASS
ncbi:hypothetical protein D9619_004894 [Psilocybe cf. subviscida]|uniref:Sodium/calcium exchanger membrane region domain-containing protein n=1 Tax=Psilocybe cf. subviscida TaxID=2480587 RepID=A0A8H5BPV3_9AGAR|nr:hypothetical protein D9619_004894 [Psilocybe cf. subviscida]